MATTSNRGGDRGAQVRLWVAEHAAALGVRVTVQLLCETAVARLGMSGIALTLRTSLDWSETRHCTDLLAGRLAELQVTVGEGPCMDAQAAGGPVLVADLDAPENQRRWPLFAPLAFEAGAGALFALPLCVGAVRVGVLALHQIRATWLEPATVTDSLAFAALTLRLLLDEQADLPSSDGEWEQGLPLHDPQLHQATGMVAAQLNVGMRDAFVRLRARAFAAHRPLIEVATDVVARRLRFESE